MLYLKPFHNEPAAPQEPVKASGSAGNACAGLPHPGMQNPADAVGQTRIANLVQKAGEYLRQLPPHAKDREAARLIEALVKELAVAESKINWYESAVCATNIPHAIGPDVAGKALDYVKVADIIRQRDALQSQLFHGA